MVPRVELFFTLAVVSAFLIVSMDARSWDLAVTIGQQIDFFSRNGTEIYTVEIPNAHSLASLAYDNKTKTMYISDSVKADVSIYWKNMSENEPKAYTFKKSENGSHITTLAFDPVTRTLFWIDAYRSLLMRMNVDGNTSQSTILHDLKEHQPWGLAIDICNRYIYWSNRNGTLHSIERSKLDGTERSVVVDKDIYEPHGVTIDYEDGKLYWTNLYRGTRYTIGRSNLDGTESEIFEDDTYHKPYYLAADKESIYWSDRNELAVWKLNKNKNGREKKMKFRSYRASNPEDKITSVITRDSVEDIDCKVLLEKERNRIRNKVVIPPTPHPSSVESHDSLTTNTKELVSTTEAEINCLNGGLYDQPTASCRCQKGFMGSQCERTVVCDGYLLKNGTCLVPTSVTDQPTPSPSTTEAAIICLNGGVYDQLTASCSCPKGFTGSRCELTVVCDGDYLKNGTCLESTNVVNQTTSSPIFKNGCAERMDRNPEDIGQDTEPETEYHTTIMLSVLITIIGILIIVVGVLSYHVHKLRRRPRIKRRFVGNKGGVTPLTTRPEVPADSYEITIENCCNMNICETPCFEPKLRTPPTKTNSTKKEEKNSLLDSMEGADSC